LTAPYAGIKQAGRCRPPYIETSGSRILYDLAKHSALSFCMAHRGYLLFIAVFGTYGRLTWTSSLRSRYSDFPTCVRLPLSSRPLGYCCVIELCGSTCQEVTYNNLWLDRETKGRGNGVVLFLLVCHHAMRYSYYCHNSQHTSYLSNNHPTTTTSFPLQIIQTKKKRRRSETSL